MLPLNVLTVAAGRLGLQGTVLLPLVYLYNGTQGNVLVFWGCYRRNGYGMERRKV